MKDWSIGVCIFILLAIWVIARKLLPFAIIIFIIYMIAWVFLNFFH